ncbi:MAG: U32 family peptidase [Epulopiscium sp.]|nr:U32 family peptidase [Candidatus Epulonipiscium sp.]
MLNTKKIELLAPAGNKESVIAAVSNGCNAIYLGGKDFSARQSAMNFSMEEIREITDYCHLRDVRVYVTVNTLYKQGEVAKLYKFLNELYTIGVDALITQDLGTAIWIRRLFPKIEIHGSTQMTIHDLYGVKFLEELNFQRIVLSREMSLEEIIHVAKNTDLDIEVFVHGALCFSYSGQCLMSSMLGGRSGNRGRCAQPCRLPYTLADNGGKELVSGYLLSPKDIQTINYIPHMIEAGIRSFKIEGRMKRPEYVGVVVKTYRKYIDSYLENQKKYSVEDRDIKDLAQVFNRGGFSNGYLYQHSGRDMMSFENPKHWGIYLGKVINYNPSTKKCIIDTVEPLEPGDGIEIWRKGKLNTGISVSKTSKAGEKIIISIKDFVKEGDRVYKTKNKSLLETIQKTYEKDSRKLDIHASISFKKNKAINLKLWDERGNSVQVDGPLVEKAITNGLEKERIRQQILKTGNTPFNIKSLIIDMDDDGYVSIKELNNIRRVAIDELQNAIIEKYKRPAVDINIDFSNLNKNIIKGDNKQFTVLIRNINDIEYVFHPKVKRIYLEIREYKKDDIEKVSNICHKNNTEFFLALPRIDVSYKNERIWYDLEDTSIDGFLIRTYGQAFRLKKTTKKIILDYTFNIFNQLTANFWMEYGVEGFTLSPELNYDELKDFKGDGIEVIGYGHLPLMTTKQCIIGNTLYKKSVKGFCSNRNNQEHYKLIDRKGETFPIIQDCSLCTAVIYNGKPILLLRDLEKILSLPIDLMRLEFTFERKEDIRKIIRGYGNDKNIKAEILREQDYTKGHYFRGVE